MEGMKLLIYKCLIWIEKRLSATHVGRQLKKISIAVSLYRSLYKIFKPAGTVDTTIHGHRVHLDPADLDITRHLLLADGAWEPRETEAFLSLVRKGMVVVDVGANIGYYTLLAARAVGSEGRVYAFEPAPKNYALLCTNVKANGYTNVVTVPAAISNRCGTARLYISPKSSGGHKLSSNPESIDTVDVHMVTLDEYFAKLPGPIDVTKLDAEGAEELILDGSTGVLKRSPNLILFTEFYPRAIQAFGCSPEGYVRKLYAYGFRVFPFYEGQCMSQELKPDGIQKLSESLLRTAPRNVINLLCARGEGLRQLESLTGVSHSSGDSLIPSRTQATLLRV